MTKLGLIFTTGILIVSLLVLRSETKNTCTYSFTVENADLQCGQSGGIKTLEQVETKANLVGSSPSSWYGLKHLEGRGHRRHGGGGGEGHKSRHRERMAGDQSVSGDEAVNKLLLTVNKLLQHQNVLDNVKLAHRGISDLKDEMHDQHESHEELEARMVALESQLQILTSGVSLMANEDESGGNSEIFRDFTGATSRFLDCPAKSKRRIHEMAPIKKRYDELVRVVPRSCTEWAAAGFTQKGLYLIDPDGMEDESPFKVECQMNGQQGVAVIHHDQETRSRVKGHDPPGSFNVGIKYEITTEQIEALIENSYHCEQFLKWECKGASISRESWWVDRKGQAMDYWAGGKDRGCACLLNDTCAGGNLCNCDSNKDTVWLSDEGNIYQKEHLPVSRLQFGDTGSSREEGFYTLGPLYCYSNKTNPYGPSNAFMPVEIYKPFNVFCNFEGWIVVARRVVGTTFSFDRDWKEYKNGFGSLEGEFWLGLEKINHLTTQGKSFTLQLAFTNAEGIHYYAQYSHFHVSSEEDGFRLYIGHFTGTSIDALSSAYGQLFSTKDKDNDSWNNGACARHATKPPSGGWWYTDCGKVFLFGKKIMWGSIDDMTSLEIMIRPTD